MDRYLQLRDRAVEFVRQFAASGPVLVLAPEREAADEVARAACTTALVGVQRLGFRDLALELASDELTRRGLIPVGRIAREALAARVTAMTELTYLKPVARFPGFPRALTETLEGLRLNGIRPEQLRGCGQSGPDLAVLLEAYEGELAERKLADYALRVRLAVERSRLPETAVATLDVLPRTRLEQELLANVMRWARVALDLRLSRGEEEPQSSLESLQRCLFSAEAPPARPGDGSVEIFSTSGESLECVEMARRIGASGAPFDETAILLRSPERHQPLVLEALRRAGIPAHCTHGASRPDAAGRSFLALLHCAEEGLSASRFAEYLSLGQMREDEEPRTPAMWERLIVDAAVIGGPDRWRTRLAGLREELARRFREERDERIERRVAAIDNLTEMALPIVDRLAALPKKATWGEWIRELTELAEFTLREPERVADLLDQLEPMGDIEPAGLSEVLLVLGSRLQTLRTPPKGSRYGRVWVGAIDEARGMAFRQVYVPGVNEGLFPRPPAEDPLLWRSQLETLGMPERGDDGALLQVAAACAWERLTLSYSRLDLLTGRERVPSFYVFAAHRAAGGPDMDVRQFEDEARMRTETTIGWPAPKNPAEAIDDLEFDLATLAPRAPGSGQYLKRLPGRAVDALRSRWVRWHKPWKAADGLVIEEIGSDALKPYGLKARPWSPSKLQQFARCPYRFALQGIFELRPVERPGAIQRLDPATRGEIYHEAQFQLLREGGQIRPETLAAALERLDAVLCDVTRRWQAELAPAIAQIWESEIAALRADLRGWLQHRASTEPDWEPIAAELSFGLSDPTGRDPQSRKEEVPILDGVRLKGSIDLVERHTSGLLRVVDHKTGRPPDPRPEMVGGGEALQPALYALAAEQMLGTQVGIGRLYYSTIARNYDTIDVQMNEWSRRRAAQALTVIDEAMRDGFLPAAPRKDGCKGCEYLPVCGPYEEERAGVKSQAELGRLKELRGWR
jgi:CRISPR/Cas system-associated exonuclease Cas4 (RecB family)